MPTFDLRELRDRVEVELDDVVVGEVQHVVQGRILADRRVGEERIHVVPHVLERPRPPDDVVSNGAARIEDRLDEVRPAPLPRGEDRGRGPGRGPLQDPREGVTNRLLKLLPVGGFVEVVGLPVVVLVPRGLRVRDMAPVVLEPPVDGGVAKQRGPLPEGEDRVQRQVLGPGDIVHAEGRAAQVGRVHVERHVLDPGEVIACTAGRERREGETSDRGASISRCN